MDAAAFGRFLSEARLARDLTLAEAARQTHIKQEILTALEQAEFERIRVSRLQLRGMLRNYVRFLQQDPDQILAWFDILSDKNTISTPTAVSQHFEMVDTRDRTLDFRAGNPWRRLLIFLLLVSLSAVSAVIVLFLVSQGNQTILTSTGESIDDASPDNAIEGVLSPSPTSLLFGPEANTTEDLALSPTEDIALRVEITQRGWLKVWGDGMVLHESLARVGEEFAFEAENELRLESGNAASLRIHYSDETFSGLGERGQLIVLTIRHDDIGIELGPGLTAVSTINVTPRVAVTPTPFQGISEATIISPTTLPTRTIVSGNTANTTEIPLLPILVSPTSIPTVLPASLTPTAVLPPRTPIGLPREEEP